MACRRVSVSLPSLRADKFSPRLARMVKAVRKSGFTFAPEAGTERLRRSAERRSRGVDAGCDCFGRR